MNRSVTREMAVHFVYAYSFGGLPLSELLDLCGQPEYYLSAAEEDKLFKSPPDETETAYLRRVVEGVALHMPELDDEIEKYSVGWRFERISRVAVAIMRVAMFEVIYMPEIPERVAINEAVEIAKKYETHEVVSFINGLLGSFSRQELPVWAEPVSDVSDAIDVPHAADLLESTDRPDVSGTKEEFSAGAAERPEPFGEKEAEGAGVPGESL